MAKHFEEAARKLLLRYLEPGEDGIGRSVAVEHLAPSRVGDRIRVTATCTEVGGNRYLRVQRRGRRRAGGAPGQHGSAQPGAQ